MSHPIFNNIMVEIPFVCLVDSFSTTYGCRERRPEMPYLIVPILKIGVKAIIASAALKLNSTKSVAGTSVVS